MATTTALERPMTRSTSKAQLQAPEKKDAAPAKKPHISELPVTWTNWYQHLHWIHVTVTLIIPLIGVFMAFNTPLQLNTFIFAFLWYTANSIAITGGYHRLWSHRSWGASTPLKWVMAIVGSAAMQDSVKVWAREHRAHHRYLDTPGDPYDVNRGLFHAHWGWLLWKQDPKKMGRTDISDLNADYVVYWQHKYYLPLILVTAFAFPTLFCGYFFNDYKGGFVYAGILKIFYIQQTTFCINSLVHYFGHQPHSGNHTAKDNIWVNFVLWGEGYHNYHHEYPTDYRSGTEWYHWEPTKWFIWAMNKIGHAHGLLEFSQTAVELGKFQQEHKRLLEVKEKFLAKKAELDFGVPAERLPTMEWDDYVQACKDGKDLILVAGIIHDVTDFIDAHPGGEKFIRMGIGKDATSIFNGGVYDHSNGAHNLLREMRVAALRGGNEVEVWKKYEP